MIKKKNFKIFDYDALINFHKRIFLSIIIFSCFYFIAIFRIADVMIFDLAYDNNKKFVERFMIVMARFLQLTLKVIRLMSMH